MGDVGFDRYIEGLNIQHEWATEVILECFVREEGVPILGLQPYVTVYRLSDQHVLSYITDTFVPIGYPYTSTDILIPMDEFGDGLYQYFFDQKKYIDPGSILTGADEKGNALVEGYSLVYRVNYKRKGKEYNGADFELHMFGSGSTMFLKVLYDQHRRLLQKHQQFDPQNWRSYKYCR